MDADKGIDFMTANCNRLTAIATCNIADNYHRLELTKDCVIWVVIVNHRDMGLVCQGGERIKERRNQRERKGNWQRKDDCLIPKSNIHHAEKKRGSFIK